MNQVVGSSLPTGAVTPRVATSEVSLFRLYTLRVAYLILAAGLGTFIWPHVLHHTNEYAATYGIQISLLAGIGLTAALGLRYPLKMLPILLFELTWKAIYLLAFALPSWRAHQINEAMAEDITNVLVVVILLPLIPWRYVFVHYVLGRGDRWK